MMRSTVLLVLFGSFYQALALPVNTTNEVCTKVIDIALVVDESGSIGDDNFEKIKLFLIEGVSRFSVDDYGAHFALVKYSTNADLVFSLDMYSNVTTIQNMINTMNYRMGITLTGEALNFTRRIVFNQNSDRRYVPNVLVLFSDGKSHDHEVAVGQANLLKKQGVEILCVGIGQGTIQQELSDQLKDLASKQEYVFDTVFDALHTIENSLVKEVCEAANPCNTKPCENNGTCSVNDDDSYQCNCTVNYKGQHCETEKDPCNTKPCDNNGTCSVNDDNSYQCSCTVDYKGQHCETEKVFIKQQCRLVESLSENRTLLFNRRSSIDWGDGWDAFLETLVHDCFSAAKEKNYQFFWIEFYGECFAINNLILNDLKIINSGPHSCWGKRPDYAHCQLDLKLPICVGQSDHGYIYEVV